MPLFRVHPGQLLLAALASCMASTLAAACEIDAAYPAPLVQRLLTPQPQQKLVSLSQRLSELSGCKIRVVEYPLARLWHTFEQGDLPLVIGAISNPDRDGHGQFHAMLEVQVVLITRADAPPVSPASLLASSTSRLGVQRGARSTVAGEQLRLAMEQKKQLDYSVDSASMLRKVQLNRTDAALSYSILYAVFQQEHLTEGLRAQVAPKLGTAAAGIYLNPSKLPAADVQALQNALIQLQKERYLARLLQGKIDRALIIPLPASVPARAPQK